MSLACKKGLAAAISANHAGLASGLLWWWHGKRGEGGGGGDGGSVAT